MWGATSGLALLGILSTAVHTQSLSAVSSRRNTSSIRIGTRSSKLALTQANKFAIALQHAGLATAIVPIDASGDQGSKSPIQDLPLALSGVDFTGALDEAVLNGMVDAAVHSLKDIPPEGRWKSGREGSEHLVIGAYLGPREVPLDALITKDRSLDSIESLPWGARVGSASVRRQAQLKATRPDLDVINLRGNVDSRLRALENDEVDALILALAGLKRLGIHNETSSGSVESNHQAFSCNQIPIETMLPGAGQGIIAITCRDDNTKVLSLLKGVDDQEARIAAVAERAFLDTVQRISPWSGRPPVAGYMRRADHLTWLFDGLLATPDGSRVLRVCDEIGAADALNEAHSLGRAAGKKVLELAGERFLDGYY